MNEQAKHSSKIKKGLMVLNKLRLTPTATDYPKPQMTSNNLMTFYQPDPEKDMKKIQMPMLSTEEFLLSNADFHVKNLLTGFLEGIEEEGKTNLIESKLKKIRELQMESVLEESNWTKSKTKMQIQRRKSRLLSNTAHEELKGSSTNNINSNNNSNIIINHFNNKKSNEFLSKKAKNEPGGLKSKLKLTETNLHNNNHRIANNINKLSETEKKKWEIIKTTANVDNGGVMKKGTFERGKTSTNISGINKIEKQSPEKIQRNSLFSAMHQDIDLNQTQSKLLDRQKSEYSFNVNLNQENDNNNGDDNLFIRPRTYNLKRGKAKDKEEVFNVKGDNMVISYRRFKSKETRHSDINHNSLVKEIDIQNIQGLSALNKDKLNKICSKLKDKVVGESGTKIKTLIKENNKLKVNYSTDENNYASISTVTMHDKHRVLSRKGYVYDSLDDEEIEDEIEGFFYIHPNSIWYIIFETLIFFSICYACIYTPYSFAHDLKHGMQASLFKKICDFLTDILFIFDVFVGFFLAFYNFEEILIKKNEDIIIHYLSSWFICDLIAAIPLDSFLLLQRNDNITYSKYYNSPTKQYMEIISILKLIKATKVYSCNKFSAYFQGLLLEFSHFNRWSKVYLSLILLLLSLHLLSCIFIFLGQVEYPNWILSQRLDTAPFVTIYIASFYYILSSVFTIGYGDITSVSRPERLFNLFLLIVGIMVYSWALSSISTYIQTKDVKTIEYQKKCQILEEIRITHEKMPYDLYDKIQRYLRYRVKHEKKDKTVIFDSLPIGLRNNLIFEMYKPVIENFIFFRCFQNTDFIVRVILAFKPILGLKNDILVKEGDYIEEIIFVKRGNLALEIPLPIVVNPESIKITALSLNKSSTKNLQRTITNTFGRRKTLYAFENPTFLNQDSLKFRSTINESQPLNTKSFKLEPIARQYVKILEIRKNEHFGDILMFLNRRSPLCVKVKSKYSEMFFLKKTDAVEISMSYPKIWRSINKKSLFNMDQIDRLINKALKLFFISHEGQKNINLEHSSIIDSIIVNPHGTNKFKGSEFPRTQEEIKQLLTDENNCELKSIPSIEGKTIKEEDEDNYDSQDADLSDNSNEEDDILINNKSKAQTEKVYGHESLSTKKGAAASMKLMKKAQGSRVIKEEVLSETQSTLRMNIENKSVLISDRGNHNEDQKLMSKTSFSQQTSNNQNTSSTPFKLSDINVEIYPNDEIFNYESYYNPKPIQVNNNLFPHNITGNANIQNSCCLVSSERNSETKMINFRESNRNLGYKNNINNNKEILMNNDFFRNLDSKSIESTKKINIYIDNQSNNSIYNKNFKTFKIPSNNSDSKRIQFYDWKDNQRGSRAVFMQLCSSGSFTISSEYKNINEHNNYDTPSTRGLVKAILTQNINEIEKALKKSNLTNLIQMRKRSSINLSIHSNLRHDSVNTHLMTPVQNHQSFLNSPTEEFKAPQNSVSGFKKTFTKSRSINISTVKPQISRLNHNDIGSENQNPIDLKRISIAKFYQSKNNYYKKTKSFNESAFDNPNTNNYININTNANNPNTNINDIPIPIPNSPNKRLLMIPLKHMKTPMQPKTSKLNVISKNIENNSLNLNNPELFYSEFFQKVMKKENEASEQKLLYKRLQDTEKYLTSTKNEKVT